MIDIAWSEFLFIAILALVLIGPKELPAVLKYIGRWVGKARAFMHEVSAQFEPEEDSHERAVPKKSSPGIDSSLPEDAQP